MSPQELCAIAGLVLLAACAAFFARAQLIKTELVGRCALGLTLVSVMLFAAGFLARWHHYRSTMAVSWAESFPVVTLFETVVFSVMLTAAAILWMPQLRRRPLFCSFLCLLGAASVLGLVLFSSQTQPSLFLPSLKSYWLAAHVALSFLAYVMFGIAAAAGLLVFLKKDAGEYALLTKNLLFSGTVVYTIGAIIFGAFWAQEAWGRFWAWDPKETCAFITWTVYAAALHMIATGKLSDKGTALYAVAGFLTVLFSYFVVNWLFVGLHSYITG